MPNVQNEGPMARASQTPEAALIKKFRTKRDKLVNVGMRVAGTRKGRDLSCMVEGIDWCISILEGARTTSLIAEGGGDD